MELGFTSVGPSGRAAEARGLHHLYTHRQMEFILHRERARADRHQQAFSLVIFKLDARQARTSGLFRLARIVLKHARTTDEIGYFRAGEIAAILPNTQNGGAWRFAYRVCKSAKAKGLQQQCEFYSYPTSPQDGGGSPLPLQRTSGNGNGDGNGNGNGNGNGHGHGNGNGNGAGHAEQRHSDVQPPVVQRSDLLPFVIKGMSDQMSSTDVPAQPLEMLFVRPLPRWKRFFDVVGAGALLIILSPLLLATSIAVKMSSPGKVIFRQRRAGLGGKPFTIYKFRTMEQGAEEQQDSLRELNEQDGPAFKLPDDPRVTRVGRFLRQTSLDELPQLFNVLRGDMSLVGPRPLPCEESDATDQWHRRRLDVTPGLTCIWQVTGRNRVSFSEWMRMDMAYMRRRTFISDVKIIAMTLPAMIFRRGQ